MSSVSSPVVSVVTPVHNTEEYLAECIESVLAQTFTDFEYIIVENASTDRSGEIAEHYARLDDRIRVVQTDRLLPQVENYNFALSLISPSSRYTKMCQADDWLFPRCLEEMVTFGDAHPTAAIISSYYLREREVFNTGLPIADGLISGREACRKFLIDGLFLFGSPTTVMYRSDLVRSRTPFFPEGRLHEDTEVCFELLQDVDFGFVHQVLSSMRMQKDSTTGRSADLLPEALDRVIIVTRFGDRYLDGVEQETVERRALDAYYGSLSRRVLRRLVLRGDRSFWAHQRSGLATVGRVLDLWLLSRHVVATTIGLLLCPRDTCVALRNVLARRLASEGPG